MPVRWPRGPRVASGGLVRRVLDQRRADRRSGDGGRRVLAGRGFPLHVGPSLPPGLALAPRCGPRGTACRPTCAMALGMITGVSTLDTQRVLAQTQDTLGRSFARLSSGRRITSTSDDAAGLAIADAL